MTADRIFNDYPIDLKTIDLTPYRSGNTGVPFCTRFIAADSGPHVMLLALVHGNELCGAHALDFLFRHGVRPMRGTLTLAFANTDAYEAFDPNDPNGSRFVDEDMNRVWSPEVLDGDRVSVELRRARELRPLIDTVDYLLDIHSMSHRCPPLMMCGPLDKGRSLARALGTPERIVSDAGHAAGRRLRDYGAFADPASPRNALLIECGQHWERTAARVAIEGALRFLNHFGLVDPAFMTAHLPADPLPPQMLIEVTDAVTIETNAFAFEQPLIGMEEIPTAGTIIAWDGDRAVRTPYDRCVLIMPSKRLRRGQTAVRLGRHV